MLKLDSGYRLLCIGTIVDEFIGSGSSSNIYIYIYINCTNVFGYSIFYSIYTAYIEYTNTFFLGWDLTGLIGFSHIEYNDIMI